MQKKLLLSLIFGLITIYLITNQKQVLAQDSSDFNNHKIATIGINQAIIQTTAWKNFSKDSNPIKDEIEELKKNLEELQSTKGNEARIAEIKQKINNKTNSLKSAYTKVTAKLKEQLFIILQDIYKEQELTLLVNTDVGSSVLIFAKKSDLTALASKRLDERTIDFRAPII